MGTHELMLLGVTWSATAKIEEEALRYNGKVEISIDQSRVMYTHDFIQTFQFILRYFSLPTENYYLYLFILASSLKCIGDFCLAETIFLRMRYVNLFLIETFKVEWNVRHKRTNDFFKSRTGYLARQNINLLMAILLTGREKRWQRTLCSFTDARSDIFDKSRSHN